MESLEFHVTRVTFVVLFSLLYLISWFSYKTNLVFFLIFSYVVLKFHTQVGLVF